MTTTSTSRPFSSSSGPSRAVRIGGTDAQALVTSSRDGGARPWRDEDGAGDPDVERRLRALVDRPWTFVRQVHGDRVVVVERPAGPLDEEADALVTASPGACVAVLGADCALVGLASAEGVVGVAHAGWRGLVAGVLERTVETMRSLGASEVEAVLGPCIHAECYEFGRDELDTVAAVLGDEVRAETSSGRPALDLPLGVRASLARASVAVTAELGGCTACGADWYSYRARGDGSRHALAVWRDVPVPGARS
ncbi:MAG: hypothetical protein JWO62_1253 [Acidimicrobiaceae bacterium]|nr:hypothetical protein [Acidimicrobiaceae bacterium]